MSLSELWKERVRWMSSRLVVFVWVFFVWMPAGVVGQPVHEGTSPGVSSEVADARGGDREVLTLDAAISGALDQNTRPRISRLAEVIAERNVSYGNADFLPTLNAVGTQQHQFGGSGLFGSAGIFTQTEAGLQLSWIAFDGLRRFETYDRLQAERRQQRFRTKAEVESVIRDVTEAYIDLQRAQGVLAALVETRELSKERLDIAQARMAAGTGSRVDVNQAKVELNGDRSAIASQQVEVRRAETQLLRVMGREPDVQFEVADQIAVNPDLGRSQLREEMLRGNYELQAAEATESIRRERLAEEKRRRWPQLDVGLGYTYTEFHSGITPNFSATPALSYNLNLTIPIFRGFNIRRTIRNARSRVAQQQFEVYRERLNLIESFEQAWSSYRRNRKRIELAEESVGLAEENVEVALTQYEAGTINQVQLRQVQVNLQEARTRLVEARFAARQAELRLRDLAGRLYRSTD